MSESEPDRLGATSPSDEKETSRAKPSKTVQMTSMIFVVIAIGIWFAVGPQLFADKPGGGFDMDQTLAAALVGGVAGGLGALVGKLIERMRT
jgi:hypothetical protein